MFEVAETQFTCKLKAKLFVKISRYRMCKQGLRMLSSKYIDVEERYTSDLSAPQAEIFSI